MMVVLWLMMVYNNLVGGWLVVSTYPSEKWSEWVTVGMIIPFPTEWKVIKFHGSSHHQPVMVVVLCSHPFYPIFPYKERHNFHPSKWLMIHPLPISVEFDNWPTWPQRYAALSPWYPKLWWFSTFLGIPKKIEKGLNQDFRKMFLSLNFQISSDFQLFSNFKLVVPKHCLPTLVTWSQKKLKEH